MTKLNNPYLISFVGLKNGEHLFHYDIGDAFFSGKDYSEIHKAAVSVDVRLAKEPSLLVFDFKLDGTVNIQCDRCGDDFDMPILGEKKLVVTLTNDMFEEGEDILALPAGESEIDLSQYLYEFISLLVPQKRIHPEKNGASTCNAEALKKLGELSGAQAGKGTDPRWDALKKIKTK